jgi:tRNA threonylcarbamoyladenosine biosynthesis protein TsaB
MSETPTPNIVAIETATETVGVAVRTSGGVEAALTLTGRRRHVETLTPALEHLLGQVSLTPAQVDVVAVDTGPGLFTGLRVGVAAAKGLAQALGIGVVGASSLEILTEGAAAAGLRGTVVSCIDARRGEVFASAAHVAGPGSDATEVLAPGLFTPDGLADAVSALAEGTIHVVGDGALRYADVLDGVARVVVAPGLSFPPPVALIALALRRLGEGRPTVEPGSVVPLYMREADAKSNFARADRS